MSKYYSDFLSFNKYVCEKDYRHLSMFDRHQFYTSELQKHIKNVEKDFNHILEEQAIKIQKLNTEISCLRDEYNWELELKKIFKDKNRKLEARLKEAENIIKLYNDNYDYYQSELSYSWKDIREKSKKYMDNQ